MKRFLIVLSLLLSIFGSRANAQVVQRFSKVVIVSNASDALTVTGTATAAAFVGPLTGNASTATSLQTPRTINGTSFDGTADITVAAAAGTLTGSTLASNVVTSSLTSVGTITSGTWSGSIGAVSGANLTHLTAANIDSGTITATFVGNLTGAVTGNASTATSLTTARAIYGNNFDGSAALTQIIASTFGGTGNGFAKFSGPATSEKTFTLPNASATVLTDNAAVTVAQGGSGTNTLTGLLKGNGTSAFSTITIPGTTTTFLRGDGTFAAPTVTVNDSDVAFTDITTGNASSSKHGYMAKLSGNSYDSALGDGTYGHTFARGTVTASDPFVFSQTYNSGAVKFAGVDINTSVTAAGAGSYALRVTGASGNVMLCIAAASSGACNESTSNAGLFIGGPNGESAMYQQFTVNNHMNIQNVRTFSWVGRAYLQSQSSRELNVGSNAAGLAYTMLLGEAPTCTSGCGTPTPTPVGLSQAGRVTLGSSPSATTVVLTFPVTWTTAPACSATNETGNSVIAAVASTTVVTLTGTFAAGNVLSWQCGSWR
jgi:hypothetical protein